MSYTKSSDIPFVAREISYTKEEVKVRLRGTDQAIEAYVAKICPNREHIQLARNFGDFARFQYGITTARLAGTMDQPNRDTADKFLHREFIACESDSKFFFDTPPEVVAAAVTFAMLFESYTSSTLPQEWMRQLIAYASQVTLPQEWYSYIPNMTMFRMLDEMMHLRRNFAARFMSAICGEPPKRMWTRLRLPQGEATNTKIETNQFDACPLRALIYIVTQCWDPDPEYENESFESYGQDLFGYLIDGMNHASESKGLIRKLIKRYQWYISYRYALLYGFEYMCYADATLRYRRTKYISYKPTVDHPWRGALTQYRVSEEGKLQHGSYQRARGMSILAKFTGTLAIEGIDPKWLPRATVGVTHVILTS